MLIVHAHVHVDAGARDDFVSFMDRFVAASRAEPGNGAFELTASLTDPSSFTLVEQWDSEHALAGHFASAHMADLDARIAGWGFSFTGTTYHVDRSEPARETIARLPH